MPVLAEVSTEITLSVGTVLGWGGAVIGAMSWYILAKDKQLAKAIAVADRATRVAERLQTADKDGDE